MSKDYYQESYEDIEFEYDDPYLRSLKRARWVCHRVADSALLYDLEFVEQAYKELQRVNFMILHYNWYQRNKERLGTYYQRDVSYEERVEEEADRITNLMLYYGWYQRNKERIESPTKGNPPERK